MLYSDETVLFSTNIIWATYKHVQGYVISFENIHELNLRTYLKNDSQSPTLEMSAIFIEYGEHVHNFQVEFYCWSGISPLVVKPKPVRVVKNGEKKLHLCNSLVTTLIFVFLKLFRETLGNAIFCLRFKFLFELEYTSRITCKFCHYSIFTVMRRILG